jgi:ABC-2 type transport system permease protein
VIRRLLTLLRQDLTGAFRDSVILYVVAAPLILAVLARLLLPSLEQATLTCAVIRKADPELVRKLEAYFRVETLPNEQALERRVLRPDDVAAVLVEDGSTTLLLEGNEQEETRSIYVSALAAILGEPGAQGKVEIRAQSLGGGRQDAGRQDAGRQGSARSYLNEYVAVFLIMLATLLGGMTVGFNMVDDRHTRAFQALAVSPLPLRDFLISRALFATLQGLAVGVLTTVILLGFRLPYGRLLVALVASGPVAVILGFLMAVMADNQIAAIGATKLIMPLYLLVPLVGIFLPGSWQWFLLPFPNYWMFLSFRSLFVATPQLAGFGLAVAVTLLSGLAADALLAPRLARVFRFRGRGWSGSARADTQNP